MTQLQSDCAAAKEIRSAAIKGLKSKRSHKLSISPSTDPSADEGDSVELSAASNVESSEDRESSEPNVKRRKTSGSIIASNIINGIKTSEEKEDQLTIKLVEVFEQTYAGSP